MKSRAMYIVLVAFALTACNHVAPHLNPYANLLPADRAVSVSSAQIDPATLKDKTVAMVVSQNYETYTKNWRDMFERGGVERAQASMQQISAATGSSMGATIAASAGSGRQESDPRRVLDDVQAVLKSAFGTIVVATDFADAQDKKADYIVLFDLHLAGSAGGGALLTWGGVYMHDASAHQLFKVENYTEAPRTLFDITSTRAYRIAMERTITALHTGLVAKLGLTK